MKRRQFLVGTSAAALLAANASAQARWELRFLRVWEIVQVRVGGANGPLIALGRQPGFTWTNREPNPSPVLDISRWVGNAPAIRLHARVKSAKGSPTCVMQTLFGGVEKQRWSFDSEAFYEIRR